MTAEELSKIPFRMVSHLAMVHEYCATYVNDEYASIPKRRMNLSLEGLILTSCIKA